MRTRLHSRTQRGASAVLVAGLSTVLLGVSAVAIDVGQIYAKRASLQSAADMAVLAAAAHLDGSNTCTTAAKSAALSYLTKNWIDNGTDAFPVSTVLDGPAPKPRPKNDRAAYMQCTKWRVTLWAPTAKVEYGLARIVTEQTSTNAFVPAQATAGVFSPRARVMPAFGVQGACDYGSWSILDPAGSDKQITSPVLPEDPGKWYNNIKIDTVTPSQVDIGSDSPLEIAGPALSGVKYVAFSRELPDVGHLEFQVGVTPGLTVTPTMIRFDSIPAAVMANPDVWWIRVSVDGVNWGTPKGNGGDPHGDALPFRYGPAVLAGCDGKNEGSFGTLNIPHQDPPATGENGVELNMQDNVDIQLSIHEWAVKNGGTTCTPGINGAVGVPDDGTNCIGVKTGFPANPATTALLTGGKYGPARLAVPTTPACDPKGGSSLYKLPKISSYTNLQINQDTLSCFVKNDGTTLGTIGTPTYSGPAKVSSKVFDAPRFSWVPILAKDPGSSGTYSIVDFRPAFITNEDASATFAKRTLRADVGDTGFVLNTNGIAGMNLFFFNANALPSQLSNGPVMEYLGVGPKVIQLTG